MAPPPLLLLPLLLFSLAGFCRAQDALPQGPVDALVGRNVTLKTLLTKPSYIVIVWTFNDGTEQSPIVTQTAAGPKVSEEYLGRVSVEPTRGSLTLTGLRPEDSGDYGISAVAADGNTETGEIKLQVLEPVSDVTIKSNLAEVIEINSTLVLNCTARGSFLTFTWSNGSAPLLAAAPRVTVKTAEAWSTLTIAQVLRSDVSLPITCTAANKLETESSAPFNVTVYFGPDAVTMSPASPPAFIAKGGNFNLSCSASSLPAAIFSWYREKELLEHFQEVLPQKVIEIYGLNKPPAVYTCVATNRKTARAVSSAGVTLGIMEGITSVKLTGPSSGPLLAGNSSANLSCAATGGSVSRAVWTKDGKPVAPGPRRTFANNMTLLSISPLQPEDAGVFVCELSNAVSSKSASFNLEVNYGPDSASVSGEEAVEVNDPVLLTCAAPSFPPANYTWTFNGSAVPNLITPTMSISKAVYKNSGMYECRASNSVTGKSATARHQLAVKEEGALDEGLSDGAIAGIVIGVLVALAAAIGLVIYCRQKVPVESPY